MTVGINSWDCLQTINDPNATNGATAGAASPAPPTSATVTAKASTESFNNILPEDAEPVTSATSNNATSSTSNNTHSLGSIKKARGPPKSGRHHAGAKYLASQYTQVKRFQEFIGISLCIPLIAYNFFNFLYHFDVNKWYVIIFAGGKSKQARKNSLCIHFLYSLF